MNRCDDCDNESNTLERYDDFIEPDNGGPLIEGYFHGQMLCQECRDHHDRQTMQVYEDLYQERKWREEHPEEL